MISVPKHDDRIRGLHVSLETFILLKRSFADGIRRSDGTGKLRKKSTSLSGKHMRENDGFG